MIRHLVMFRRLRDIAAQREIEASLVERMRGLSGQIDFARTWRLSANELDRPICWDYVLESAFDDRAAVQRFLQHPAHVALAAELRTYFEWAVCDYTEA
ncbi:Dabb family protein [Paraburkholderia dipogonis]|jgi:hypothetical protein|uniref:Dabb family protein n=1 Tax=Paraburkholderia dipogonis TaxID=1211383 RepID=UPI0038BA4C61